MSHSLSSEYTAKIKRWVELDNNVEIRKTKLKAITDEKKMLEDDILEHIEDKDMQNVQININGGNIKFVENKGYQGISLKSLKENLKAFFDTHAQKGGELTAETVYEYLLGKRDIKTKLSIKRTITS